VAELPPRLTAALRDRYRLERELGRGGMGSVYLAEDLKHHRRVAVKVLRPDLSASLGTDRFLREIEVAARLQHPAILPLHDSGQADGYVFYIMPYVEGESLRDRLARQHELTVEETARILSEVLDALAYAHGKGVVHRDIKPDNIMLSGRHALLLDFGVAKAVNDSAGPEFVTTTGLALGTPSYMAPEQAVADKQVDHRADLYALGVVGYEMLAGRRPFPGNTAQQIVVAQMTKAPDELLSHRPSVPPPLAAALMRAIERNPADRWQSAAEMAARLAPYLVISGESTPAARPAFVAGRRRARWIGVAAGLVVALAAVAGAVLLRPRPAPQVALGGRVQVTLDPGLEIEPAVSPDGRLVAYAAGTMNALEIRVRQRVGGAALAVAAQSERPQRFPTWSPDGTLIMFGTPRGIEVVSALGGPARLVVPDEHDPAVDPWGSGGPLMPAGLSPDGRRIAFVRRDTLLVRDLDGGPERALAHDGEMHSFSWSPDGKWIACVRGNRQSRQPSFMFGNIGPTRIWLVPVEQGKQPLPVTDDQWFNASPTWTPDSRTLLFLSNRAGGSELYQLTIGGDGKPEGGPARLSNGLRAQAVSLSADGRWLAYADWTETSNVWSLPIPSGGPVSIREAQPVTFGNQIIESFDISRDGARMLFDSDRGGTMDLYRQPPGGGEPERLTQSPADEFWPQWSPDGKEIALHSFVDGRRRLFVMSSDGGSQQPVTDTSEDARAGNWTADGRSLFYLHDFNMPSADVRMISRSADGRWGSPRTIFRGNGYPPVHSPDGRLVAFTSNGAVYLVKSSGDSVRALVRLSDSTAPRAAYVAWSGDSKTLYYLAPGPGETTIWAVPAGGGPSRLLVRFDDPNRPWHRYGFAARGGRFYFTVGDRQSDIWAAEVNHAP
jgi:eukaryotic-like serine/threonine-protein kinase